MAITKMHPIRSSTLPAIEYITNPKKTDGKLLVSSFACQPECADLEFARVAAYGSTRGSIRAQHMIQSFAPGEVDEKTAHEIGIQLANRLTEGKHQYVIATHIDRGHVHNHIIFNQVDFMQHKKFRGNKVSVRIMQQINDDLCKSYGLSVIEEKKERGKSYKDWQKVRESKTHKRILRRNIDLCISISADFDMFLSNMRKLGYEIKNIGSYYSFRLPDQKRFKRLKTLGEHYSEESIRDRIGMHASGSAYDPASVKSASLLVSGITKNLSGKSNAYKNIVASKDAQKLAQTYNFLAANDMLSVEKLEKKIAVLSETKASVRADLKEIENRTSDLKQAKEYLDRIGMYQNIYDSYLKSGKNQSFLDNHYAEITLYEAATKGMRRLDAPASLTSESVKKELEFLTLRKMELKNELTLTESSLKEFAVHYQNASFVLGENAKTAPKTHDWKSHNKEIP